MGISTPCREWQGARLVNGGYGAIRRGGKVWRVHRWVMAQVHGEQAIQGKVVMHLCDNPPCFRLDHLAIGTQADNMADRNAKGRQARGNQYTRMKEKNNGR
jgi:hypothetical protein